MQNGVVTIENLYNVSRDHSYYPQLLAVFTGLYSGAYRLSPDGDAWEVYDEAGDALFEAVHFDTIAVALPISSAPDGKVDFMVLDFTPDYSTDTRRAPSA